MNARSQTFEFLAEFCQVEEVVCSVLHTLLFHRSTGKFTYQQEGSYTIGTIGYEDVHCHFIDLTYVRLSCDELNKNIVSYSKQFKESLKKLDGPKTGQLTIEFYQKRKNPWPFPTENVPWEQWNLKFDVISVSNESERAMIRDKLTSNCIEKICSICEIVNQPEYVPKMPNESDLTNVFDDRYASIQPYLFKISQTVGDVTSEGTMGNTMRKLLKDTFNY